MVLKLLLLSFSCLLLAASDSGAAADASAVETQGSGPGGAPGLAVAPVFRPAVLPLGPKPKPASVNWDGVFRQSAVFLAIEHSFRWATEPGTRDAKGPLLSGFVRSVGNLHGWSDGDPFYVNYVGHPMQGAAAGYIWNQNDRKYSSVSFGNNRQYWKSRLRAAAFSWAYSTQFEIGPLSEATVGYIQSRYPQQGLVDHVVTPAFGMAWMVGEDAVDRYLLIPLERRIQNKYIRIMARGFMTPSRSMANMVAGKVPYYRADRSISVDRFTVREAAVSAESAELAADQGPAPFELTAAYNRRVFRGLSDCTGAGAEAAFRMAAHWQLVVDVNGCALSNPGRNRSGDALSYLVGPRWTPSERRFRPYMQFLVGGMKLTAEEVFPEKKALLEAAGEKSTPPLREEYATSEVSHGFAVAAGMGVDWTLSRSAAVKVASIEYTRAWNRPLGGSDYNTGLQLKLGLTLRMGTW